MVVWRSESQSAKYPGAYLARIQASTCNEFMSRALEDWAYRRGVQLDFIRPGKPVENAFIDGYLTKAK